jgi:cellulase
MAPTLHFIASLLLGLATAQSPTGSPDAHPKLDTWKCTKSGGCVKQNTLLVLDALSHPVHQVQNPRLGCGNWGEGPNKTVCPDEATCQKNCVMEGIQDYTPYGVSTAADVLTMKQLRIDGSVASPRLYLLAEGAKKYEMLQLTGKEISFDTDVSKLPCGMNAALYLSEMKADGGQNALNTGGATYGTGYCDAQCFTTPFIDGVVS